MSGKMNSLSAHTRHVFIRVIHTNLFNAVTDRRASTPSSLSSSNMEETPSESADIIITLTDTISSASFPSSFLLFHFLLSVFLLLHLPPLSSSFLPCLVSSLLYFLLHSSRLSFFVSTSFSCSSLSLVPSSFPLFLLYCCVLVFTPSSLSFVLSSFTSSFVLSCLSSFPPRLMLFKINVCKR